MAKAKGRSRIAPSRSRVQSSYGNAKADALKDEIENDSEMTDEVGRCSDGGCYVDCGFMYRLRERRPKSA